MKYCEIISGLQVPINNEEQEIINRIGNNSLKSLEMDERTLEVCRQMARRGVLKRFLDLNRNVCYKVNSLNDIWRYK